MPKLTGCYQSSPVVLARAVALGYHLRNLAPAPPIFDGTGAFTKFQMFLNDTYGDCVMAESANALLGLTAGASGGTPTMVSNSEVSKEYFSLTGGRDNGLNIAEELAWETTNGLQDVNGVRHPCGPYGTVDPTDAEQFAQGM